MANLNEVPSTRARVIDTAKQIITKDRTTTHGSPEDSLSNIARLWTAYLNNHLKLEGLLATLQLLPHDVAQMMTLLKVARAQGNPLHEDNWIDQIGYSACGAQAAERFVSE